MADTVALMRKRVLDMAIRGELVEQRPVDGTAEELLSQIYSTHNFNAKLADAPFTIPKSWEWVKHNYLFEIIGGSQPPKSNFVPEYKEGYIRLYQIRDYGKNPQPVYVPKDKVTKFTEDDDILLARYGASVGKVFLAEKGAYNVAMARVTPLFDKTELVNTLYMYYFYHSHLYQNLVLGINRSAQAGFNKRDLDALFIPLPPLKEQKRIVAKIEEIFAVIDQIGTRKEEALTIINKMRQTALRDAIMGVLVEQDETDEPASELYKKIQIRKEKLIQEKKIKKEKPFPDIAEDEIPFEIPDNWKWVRLGSVTSIKGGKRVPKGEKFAEEPTEHIYLRVTDMHNNTILSKSLRYITDETFEKIKSYTISKDDLYLTIAGSIGRVGTIPDEYQNMNLTENACKIQPFSIDKKYLMYELTSQFVQNQFQEGFNQLAQPKLSIRTTEKTLIPLPPLAEQERIVEKLDEIMAISDQMEAILDETSETNETLKVAE